ncbi:MAG: amidohydrolase family protein [Chloroflexi bacterium]|nr:amidohydrolase family protein [Chloroflexota bacterium]
MDPDSSHREPTTGAAQPYDLLLQGGRVIDPDSGRDGRFDVAFTGDRVAAIEARIDPGMAKKVVPMKGAMVVPGLIDPHAHVCDGIGIGIPPDVAGVSRGATTVVDGGTCGANTFGAFKRVMAASRTRTLAWLHISTIGLVDTRLPECLFLPTLNVEEAVATAKANPYTIVGFKARLSSYVTGGGSCMPTLRLVLEAGKAAGLPVMVHVGDTTEPLGAIIDLLRPGDVVTHYLTPRKNGILGPAAVPGAKIIPQVEEGRARGVIFDSSRGMTQHMGFAQMQAAVESGLLPDTLSTDLTDGSALNPYHSLLMVATEFMSFGVEVEELLPRMTINSARMLRRKDLGKLQLDGIGDASILKVEVGDFAVTDGNGWVRKTNRRLVAIGVVRAGSYTALNPPPAN